MVNLKRRRGELQVRARGGARRSTASASSPRPTAASSTRSHRRRTCEHPYKRRGVIGSIEDLDAATLADVRRLPHAPTTGPTTRRSIVAGDFEPQPARRLGRQVLRADAAPGRAAAARSRPSEPAVDRPTASITVTAPKVPLPAVAHDLAGAAGRRSADAPALQVAARAARRRRVVAPQPVARLPPADRDPGRLQRRPARRPGPARSPMRSPPAASRRPTSRAALLAEVTRLAERAAERGRARQGQDAARHAGLQCRGRRRSAWPRRSARPRSSKATPARVNTDLDELQRVTAADVQRVMRRYVLGAHKVTIDYAQEEARRNEPAGPPPRQARLAAAPCSRSRSPARSRRPSRIDDAAAAGRRRGRWRSPRRARQKLANGLRVIVARREGVPLVSAELVALAGAEADPPRSVGARVADRRRCMTQGTRRRSAPELAAAAEALGGSLDSGAGWNQSLRLDDRDDAAARRRARARRRGRARAGVRARRDRAHAQRRRSMR